MGTLRRMTSIFHVTFASSTAFATVGTALTTVVVIPLLELGFNVFFARDLQAYDPVRVIFSAALVAAASAVCAGIVAGTVQDRMLGLFQEIHIRRRLDVAYWVARSLLPIIMSLIGVAGSLVLVLLFYRAELSEGDVSGFLSGLPAALLVGVLLGIFASGIGSFLSDPYVGSTLVSVVLPVTSGVIVPVALYPEKLAMITQAFPLTRTVASLGNSRHPFTELPMDVLVACPVACIGLAGVQLAVNRMRRGYRYDLS